MTFKEKCTFCTIYKNKKEIIYHDMYFFAIFDKYPVSPGHVEVIPKRHIPSIFDLTQDEWNMLFQTISHVIEIIKKTDLKRLYKKFIECPLNNRSIQFCKKMIINLENNNIIQGYNIGVNEGYVAGRTIDHLHIHIIPRYEKDVHDPIGGIRNVIPGMGNYRKPVSS